MTDATNATSGNEPHASKTPRRIVVGITGASGACYAVRVIELLAASGIETHIANGRCPERLAQIVAGKGISTKFPPQT